MVKSVEYVYTLYGNSLNAVYIYRLSRNGLIQVSSDHGKTYKTIDQSELEPCILDRLSKNYEMRWGKKKLVKEKIAVPINNSDTGITVEEFLTELQRIYDQGIVWDESKHRLYSVYYDPNGNKILKNFNRKLLRKLAIKLKYYGKLPGGLI